MKAQIKKLKKTVSVVDVHIKDKREIGKTNRDLHEEWIL
jgi:hypothetical protein